MADFRSCPSRDELQRMVLGQLPDLTAQRIQQHLERCPKCCSALDQCVASDGFLAALRASGHSTSEPTKTMHVPIQCIRGVLSTWIGNYDRTQSGKSGRPFSMEEITRRLSPPQSADEIGRLGDFRVLRVLGVGGFAVVFEAEDSRLKRRVALKLMHPAISERHGGADRFLREAQSAAALKHEHVVTIYQVGTQGETPFIALELLHGETLEDYLIRVGRISIREVTRIGREIASGLTAAHARGLLHRDIKPANIWLEGSEPRVPQQPGPDDQHNSEAALATESSHAADAQGSAGKVKILDFGCAKSWADEVAMSDQGLLIGTPAYMAPEQFSGDAVDPRTDLFSLGCVLYRMAAGRRPFGGDNVFSVVRALALEEPPPLHAVNPQVPRSLSDLVGRLVSKSLDARPATAQAVVFQLRAIEEDLSRQQSTKTATGEFSGDFGARRRWSKKSVIVTGIGLAVLLPIVFLLFGAQLIRIATDKGQIVVKVEDPTVTVTLSEGQIVIHDGQGQAEITLAAGEHQFDVTVKHPSGETRFKTSKFTLSRGGRKVIEVEQELANAAAALTPTSPENSSIAPIPKEQRLASPARDLDRRAALWVLSLGGTVELRVGHAEKSIDVQGGKALPSSEFRLTKVQLENEALTDAALEHLRGLQELVELKLVGKQITGSGFEHLQNLSRLRSLIVRGAPVTDDPLKYIQGLTKLEILSLENPQVTDAGLVHLKALTNLRELNLSWARVTDVGLAQLQDLSKLEALYLRGLYLSDRGLVHLRRLKKLRTLYLAGQPLTDGGLAAILGLENLQVLGLASTQITDSGVGTLSPLKNLQLLDLDHTRVTDAGLAHLRHLPNVEVLNLEGTNVTEAGLAELQGVKNLRILRLKGALRLGDSAIDELLRLRRLSTIDLLGTDVTAEGLARLKAGFPSELRIIWSDPNVVAAKAVLATGGRVDVRLEKAGTDTPVRLIAELPSEPFRLTGATISGTRTALEGLFAQLTRPGINSLVSVDLSGAAIGDADLVCLQRLPKGLRRLVLAGSAIRGPGLKVLGRFTHLNDLVLSGTGTTDAGLAHLQGLAELSNLELDRTLLTDAGLASIGPLRNLHSLSLKQTAVSDAGLKHLEGLHKLTSLVLDLTRVSDAGLAHLRSLSALTNLGLSNTAVTNAGLARIQHLANLDSLWLVATGVTDSGIASLKGFKKLRLVSLNWTKVTNAGLIQLAGMTQLEGLHLRGLSVTDAGLAHLQGLTNLRLLNLSRVAVTDAGLAHIAGLKNLEHLNLEETRITDAGLRYLAKMSRLDTLLLKQTGVTEAGLSELQSFKRLSILGLRDLPGVGDPAVPKIVGLSSLQEVDLRNTHVSAKGVAVLKSVRPKLQVAWSEPNDSLAKAVLTAGGSVDVHLEGADSQRSVRAIAELPAESFAVTGIRLAGRRRTLEELLPTLVNPRLTSLVSIDLSGGPLCDSDLERLKPLVALKELKLARTQITDAGLANLTGMTALRSLVLDGDAVSGQGLLAIQRLPELTELRLGCPALTDLFLGELATLPKLERLSLAGSNLSDDGARYLSQLTHLKGLDLRHTNVTAVRVAELKKRLPNCHIISTIASSPEFDSK